MQRLYGKNTDMICMTRIFRAEAGVVRLSFRLVRNITKRTRIRTTALTMRTNC